MRYISTRGGRDGDEAISSAAAIIEGLAPDRGLYVPESIPGLFRGKGFGEGSRFDGFSGKPCAINQGKGFGEGSRFDGFSGKSCTINQRKSFEEGSHGDADMYHVPESIPGLFQGKGFGEGSLGGADMYQASALAAAPYKDVSKKVLGGFFTDFSDEELSGCVERAYDAKFDAQQIAPVVKTDKAYFLELWHGSTAAFKDMALSILPWLLTAAVRKEGETKEIAILTATSGDTGKAALAGFAGVPGTQIFVFYPKKGVSVIQERQMLTQTGGNVHVYGIRGNFDEAQTGVKNVFTDDAFAGDLDKRGIRLSSANSINIGRLVPQVAYYVNAYMKMVGSGELADGEQINICVPTGNFGNILAAWYAKQMGLPVARLICASNENRVLTDFINTGVYDARREFILTSSPSMDILVSSNLERLLWHLSGGDSERIRALMASLERDGVYDAGAGLKAALRDFHGGCAEMNVSHAALARLWREERYLIDTHTAVAYAVYLDYRAKTGDKTKTVIASTASPYKFAGNVADAIGVAAGADEFRTIENICEATGLPVPRGLLALDARPILHDTVIGREDIRSAISSALL